jgi:Na+-driven multidrug efflux pump
LECGVALATIAASLITALSLLFLVIQVRQERRYTLAEFVNGLGKEFAEFDKIFELLLLHMNRPSPSLDQEELLRRLRFF